MILTEDIIIDAKSGGWVARATCCCRGPAAAGAQLFKPVVVLLSMPLRSSAGARLLRRRLLPAACAGALLPAACAGAARGGAQFERRGNAKDAEIALVEAAAAASAAQQPARRRRRRRRRPACAASHPCNLAACPPYTLRVRPNSRVTPPCVLCACRRQRRGSQRQAEPDLQRGGRAGGWVGGAHAVWSGTLDTRGQRERGERCLGVL